MSTWAASVFGRRGHTRRDFLRLSGAGLAAAGLGFPAIASAAPRTRSVILLGIDGMDPGLLERFVREGRMPNARRLMASGGFAPLRTSDPPQSPVAWSNVIAGTNPGGHGIYDFIARDPATRIPYLSTSRVEGRGRALRVGDWSLPLSGGRLVNLRGGATFWKDLSGRGVDCTIFRMPANFPPTVCDARTLSGMGTPDIRGGYGVFTLFTDRVGDRTRDVTGGRIERIAFDADRAVCTLVGPANPFDTRGRPVTVPLSVARDPVNPAVLLEVQGRKLVLREGAWSDWVAVRFALAGGLDAVPGVCRFFLRKARDPFGLYVSPINLDPVAPGSPICTPPDYARQLAEATGRFYTQGMPEDVSALSAGALDDDEYRQQAGYALDESLRLFDHEFGRFDRGLFFYYFSTLDLNSHAFWRTLDPGHPLYSAEAARKHADYLPSLYARMDEVIGRALARASDETLVMAISDHGFGTFRRQVNLNAWLLDNGYVTLADRSARGAPGYFPGVRWSGTRAYGLGINGLYLNMKGREPDGAVAPGAEREALLDELARRLKDWRDPRDGEKVIRNVYRPQEIYSGPYVDLAPDLVVGYAPTYRASWETVLGGFPREQVLDNRDAWSGDHAMDASFMSGVLLCSRAVRSGHPALTDIAPTVLAQFGAPKSAGMTGNDVLG